MIFKRLKAQINNKINYVVNRQNQSMQTTFSYMQLSNLFSEDVFIPMTSWSISPNLILHVLNDIEINDRKLIVEFGSGASTIYISKLLKMKQSNAVFYSVESDESWMKIIFKQLQALGLDNQVKLILAPKTEAPASFSYKTQQIWYNQSSILNEIDQVSNIDLVLVDGPSGGRTPYARYSAIPFLEQKLASNYSIFLDDTNRNQEKEIAQLWSQQLGGNLRLTQNYAHIYSQKAYGYFPYKV